MNDDDFDTRSANLLRKNRIRDAEVKIQYRENRKDFQQKWKSLSAHSLQVSGKYLTAMADGRPGRSCITWPTVI